MENSYKDMYDNILNNYEEYLKVVDICHNLSMIRINKLIKTFGGNNYENECFYKEIKNDNISYALDIYCDKIDSTSLILHSSKGSDDLERILSENVCMVFPNLKMSIHYTENLYSQKMKKNCCI